MSALPIVQIKSSLLMSKVDAGPTPVSSPDFPLWKKAYVWCYFVPSTIHVKGGFSTLRHPQSNAMEQQEGKMVLFGHFETLRVTGQGHVCDPTGVPCSCVCRVQVQLPAFQLYDS